MITLLLASFDIVIAMLSFIGSIWVDAALMALIGLGNGYRAILLITWMQTRTLKAMSGRIMSTLIFWD